MRQDLLRIAREALLESNLGGKAAFAFSNALRTTRSTFALRWIGFSEDDAKNQSPKAQEFTPTLRFAR
jgi:hypothetical protein